MLNRRRDRPRPQITREPAAASQPKASMQKAGAATPLRLRPLRPIRLRRWRRSPSRVPIGVKSSAKPCCHAARPSSPHAAIRAAPLQEPPARPSCRRWRSLLPPCGRSYAPETGAPCSAPCVSPSAVCASAPKQYSPSFRKSSRRDGQGVGRVPSPPLLVSPWPSRVKVDDRRAAGKPGPPG